MKISLNAICLVNPDETVEVNPLIRSFRRQSAVCQVWSLVSKYGVEKSPVNEKEKTLQIIFSAQSTAAIIYVIVSLDALLVKFTEKCCLDRTAFQFKNFNQIDILHW